MRLSLRKTQTTSLYIHRLPPSSKIQIPNMILNFRHSSLQLLKSCTNLKALLKIHAHLLVIGSASSPPIQTPLLNSYTSLLQPEPALSILASSPHTPSTILYNSTIRCFTQINHFKKAILLYHQMLEGGIKPDKFTFTFVLKACAGARDVDNGVLVHGEVVNRGLDGDVFIGTGLVDMYAKLGMVETAYKLFVEMPVSDSVSWNAIISGFAQSEDGGLKALGLFRKMRANGVEPNSVTFLNLFPAVCEICDVWLCKGIHGVIVKRGDWLRKVCNGLIDVYSKCGDVGSGRRIFDGMLGGRDDVSWASMISGYVYNGWFGDALELFDEMRLLDLKLNQVSVVSALSAVAEIGDLERGVGVYDYAVHKGVVFDVPTTTVLMTMYSKCGDVEKAKLLFDGIEKKDTVAWSAIISAFVQMSYPKEALSLFREMQIRGFVPNKVTLVGLLPACGDLVDLKSGKSIHCYALRSRVIGVDVSVGTALVSMYAQCELFSSAHTVFDSIHHKDIVTWNALINGYAQNGDASNVLRLFQQLRSTGQQPDPGTMVGVLPACALLTAAKLGASVHGLVIKNGFEADIHVKNATIDMYAKSGDFSSAGILFCETKFNKDVISWNTMIAGYMYNGSAEEAVSVFLQMRAENLKPNSVTLVSIIPAVAHLGSIRNGLALHCFVICTGFESHVTIGNSLIDLYSKCGRIDYAQDLFDWMDSRDTVTWNVMLSGFASHGLSERSIELFKEMKHNGIKVDSLSFLGVLSACRHGGLVEEGKKIFESIELEPCAEHYACMVDLLGRAGQLDEAWNLIQKMRMAPDAGVWGALLGACRIHSNLWMGERAVENLVKLEPENPAHFVVLSNIYAQVGRWADARNMRAAMSDIGVTKTPGCSWAFRSN